MELTIVVHQERQGFWAEITELPGCFASGRTLGELEEALDEAVGMWLGDKPVKVERGPLAVGLVAARVTGSSSGGFTR